MTGTGQERAARRPGRPAGHAGPPGPDLPAIGGGPAGAGAAEPRPSWAEPLSFVLLAAVALGAAVLAHGPTPLAVAAAAALLLATGVATTLWWRLAVARWERRRDRARAERQALEERIQLLSRHANDLMLLADERRAIVDVNERAADLLGWARQELLGQPLDLLLDPAEPEAGTLLRPGREPPPDGEIFEARFRRRDGSTFPVEVSARPAELSGRRFLQAVVRDVTERRRLQLQLQLADRLASAATLAAGAAHEINNPLAYVLANLDYALGELTAPAGGAAELKRALVEARDGAARVRDIVRDLRTFSHGSDPDRSPVDLRRVLQATVALAQQEIRQVARLSLELGEVPPVLGGEHRLGQALLNLLVNAVQAIPPGAPQAHLVRAATSVAEDGRVAVEIADTGAGIPADRLARIFDPFFTTRPAGSGLGLGLAIVHAIIDDLGGEVRVRSEPGRGSTFTLLLPPAPPEALGPAAGERAGGGLGVEVPEAPVPAGEREPATPRPVAEPPAPARPGPGRPAAAARVLVVDDEPLVGRAVSRVLSPPHRVTVVHGGAEALPLLDAGGWDVVFCDLMMPGMSGMELHARVATRSPGTAARFVFLTGGAFAEAARRFLEQVPNPRVEKPFEPQALRDAVAAALAAGGSGSRPA